MKEFRIVFFPWRVLIVLAVFGGLLGWIAGQVINPNAGYVVFVTMIGHYMVYETFHFCCHVPENWFVRNMPFVNTIRRHHAAHHNMGIMMHCNMNLTFPVADWALNTSDLDRGLLGHLFNGYDETHVKEELKPLIAKFRTSETQDARCTLDGPKLERGRRAGYAGTERSGTPPDLAALSCSGAVHDCPSSHSDARFHDGVLGGHAFDPAGDELVGSYRATIDVARAIGEHRGCDQHHRAIR